MRLHRIRLANYRSVTACEIQMPDSGIVVIEGDNEVGKSSLAEALGLILDYHDDSESSAVRSVRPVHRDASPEVELEVSTGPYRFRYLKRFGKDRKTELRILAPVQEQLTGREAHQRVLSILDETTDVALWRALRIQQGAELRQADLANHPSLAAALDQAAGAALGGDREHSLFDRVRAEFDRYFTPTGQDGKSLKTVRVEAEQAGAELDRFERSLAELEAMVERHMTLEAGMPELYAQLAEAKARAEALRASWDELERHREAAELLRQAARGAELARTVAAGNVSRREAEVQALDAKRRLLESLPQPGDSADVAESEGALARAATELAAATALLEESRETLRLREADVQHCEDVEWAAQMGERAQRLEANQQRLSELADFLAGCGVTPEALKSLEEVDRDVLTLRGRLEAEQVTLEIEAQRATQLELNGAQVGLEPGTPLRAHVTAETRISLPGVLELRVVAGSSLHEITEKLAATEERIARLCSSMGVGSLQEARVAERERQLAERDRTAIRQQMANDLRDLTPQALAAKLERTRTSIAVYAGEREPGLALPATLEEAKRARQAAGVAVTIAMQRQGRAEQAHRDAASARDEAVNANLRSTERAAAARDALVQAEAALALARQAASDDVLQSNLAAAEVDAEAAAGRSREAASAVATRDAGALKAELDAANQRVAALAAELRRSEDDLRDARQFLNIHGESGLHDARDRARARVERGVRELEATEAQAAAARLLHDTMLRARTQARRNYAGPFRAKVDALGRLVFGATFEVELDDELRISRRTLGGVTVDFAQLSAGAREQLSIIARLACASLVSNTGGVPLVLDDILSWSDPGRLESISEALVIGSRDCQVILLTCTPERFAAVRPATVIHLPDGRVTRREARGSERPPPAQPSEPVRKPVATRTPAAQLQGAFDLPAEPSRQN